MISLPPSTYYYRPKVSRAEREARDADLRGRIEAIQAEFPRAGYRVVRGHFLRQGERIDHELTCEALRSSMQKRNPQPGCIHHSDQGVQYACDAYIYDNAFAESFMKTLKRDEVSLWSYETIHDVLEQIPFFIEEVYNKKRLHSGIGYLPPAEFEDLIKNGESEINETACRGVLKLPLNSSN